MMNATDWIIDAVCERMTITRKRLLSHSREEPIPDARAIAATITTLNLYGTLDLSLASGTITVTNFNRLSEDAVIYDPLGRLVATNGIINGAGIRRINNYTSAGGRTYTIS